MTERNPKYKTIDAYIAAHGDGEFFFSSYYKYSFCFTRRDNGHSFSIGGSANDIYRIEIESEEPMKVSVWEPKYIFGKEDHELLYEDQNAW